MIDDEEQVAEALSVQSNLLLSYNFPKLFERILEQFVPECEQFGSRHFFQIIICQVKFVHKIWVNLYFGVILGKVKKLLKWNIMSAVDA